MKKGKFIVLEGITCTGKSTLAKMLVDDLNNHAVPAIFNHEPTKLLFGAIVRAIAEKHPISPVAFEKVKERIAFFADRKGGLSKFDARLLSVVNKLSYYGDILYGRAAMPTYEDMQILFIADRREDLLLNVIPKIGQGINIIQDRYEMSTFAFGMATDVSREKIAAWHAEALKNIYVKPDAVFYIDIPPREALERLEKSGKIIDIYEEKLERLQKIRENYLYLLDTKRFQGAVIVDGRRKLEEVFDDVKLLAKDVIGKTG